VPIRLVIVDDHPIVLQGLKQLFERESDFAVTATCQDADIAFSTLKRERPDVLLLDMRMPGATGLELVQALSDAGLACPTVLLTAAIDDAEVIKAVKMGVRGLVMKDSAPETLVDAVRREFGRLDILVNNAGATQRGDFFKLTDAEWADGFALKFFAHVRLTREAWPLLKAQHGSLVTIAGIGGKEPEAPFTIGSSVNAACVAFSKAMADIGKTDGVQVNSINPGRVETARLWRRFRETMESTGRDEAAVREDYRLEFDISRFGKVEDLGSLIAFLASTHGRWLHGATIDIDGGEVRSV